MKLRFLHTSRLYFPLASAIAALFSLCSASAQSGTWTGNSGNWSDTTNPGGVWTGGIFADGSGFTANFTGVDIAANQTITLDANRTIGNITFTDATTSSNNLLISGGNILTLDVSSGTPTINVTQSGRTLTIDSVIAGTEGLQKTGAGGLILNGPLANTFTGGLNANGGTLTLDFNSLVPPTNLINPANALSFGGGTVTLTGQNLAAATTSQTFASTTLGVGFNRVNISKGALAASATLNLGALTVAPGSATTIITGTAGSTTWANGTIPNAEIIKISSIAEKPLPVASGASNWINVNAGLFYRQSTSANSARWVNVNNLGNLLPIPASLADQGTSGTVTVARTLGAADITLLGNADSYGLLVNSNSAARTLNLGTGNFTYTINGIIGIGASKAIISPGTGGTIVIGSEKNLVINMDNTGGVDINAPIVDNGAGASGVTIVSTIPSGTPGTVVFGGANTYTGATLITASTLSLTGSITGGGAISTSGTGILTQSAAGVISGASTFTQGTSGTSTLGGANTYTGATIINTGILAVSNATALGSTAGNTTIAATGTTTTGGRLSLSGGITSAENITITGGGETSAFGAAISNTSGNNTLSGDITLSNPTSGIRLGAAGGSLTFSGNITQTGTTPRGLVLQASAATSELLINNPIANIGGGLSVFGGGSVGGTVTLKGVSGSGIGSTLIGQTVTLKLGVTNALNTSGNLTIANAGTTTDTFDLAGFNQTVNGLSSQTGGNRRVSNSVATTTSTLTVGNGGGSATFNGIIQDGAGNVALTKTGTGTQTLTGANTYTGSTVVTAGTLKLDTGGSIANSSSITLASSSTLDVSTLTTALALGSAQSFTASGTGANPTASVTTLATKGLTLSAAGLSFSAYGGANGSSATNAPLTVTGTSAGEFNLNGAPITITTTASLAPGNYVLIAAGGSATVTGTPGALNVTGSGASGTPTLAVTGGQLVLTVGAGSPYVTWATEKGLTGAPGSPTDPAKNADPDNDGRNNIAEFAFNGNPLSGSDNGKVFVLTEDSDFAGDPSNAKELILTVAVRTETPAFAGSPSPTANKAADDITYSIEGSLDLASFPTTVNVVPTAIVPVSLPAPDAGYEYRSFSLSGSDGLAGKGFLRAKVTSP